MIAAAKGRKASGALRVTTSITRYSWSAAVLLLTPLVLLLTLVGLSPPLPAAAVMPSPAAVTMWGAWPADCLLGCALRITRCFSSPCNQVVRQATCA